MTIDELVAQAKVAAGKPLADMPDERAKALIRRVFAEIIKSVEAGGEDEPVRVNGLGVFRTGTVMREKDGVQSSVKRTLFRIATPPSKT